jgi:hypothetical protein
MMMTMAMAEIYVSQQWNGLLEQIKVLNILASKTQIDDVVFGAISTRLGAPPIEQSINFRYHDDRVLLKLLKTITVPILIQYSCIIYQNHCLITDDKLIKFVSALNGFKRFGRSK